MNTKLSVIMGVYNGASTLPEAIDSILDQGFQDFEFIICDDASTDHSLDVLTSYQARDPRIILIRNTVNQGLGYTLNKCANQAASELLVRQDADDISYPDRLEKLYQFMHSQPEVAVAGTWVDLITQGKKWGNLCFPVHPARVDWLVRPQIVHPSCVIRLDAFRSVGGYATDFIRVEDMELWFRLLEAGYRIDNIPSVYYGLTWGHSDYRRRRSKHRFTEARCKWIATKRLGLPFYYRVFSLKSLIFAFIPASIMYRFHQLRYSLRKTADEHK